jgi:WhiB family redox-sensing transcriptional regulator
MARDWREDAACQGMDTEMWFPAGPRARGAEAGLVRQALEICGGCPVRMACLEFAVRTVQRGIWGGMTEEQRRQSRLCKRMRADALAS